jgi:hypothetical protein
MSRQSYGLPQTYMRVRGVTAQSLLRSSLIAMVCRHKAQGQAWVHSAECSGRPLTTPEPAVQQTRRIITRKQQRLWPVPAIGSYQQGGAHVCHGLSRRDPAAADRANTFRMRIMITMKFSGSPVLPNSPAALGRSLVESSASSWTRISHQNT